MVLPEYSEAVKGSIDVKQDEPGTVEGCGNDFTNNREGREDFGDDVGKARFFSFSIPLC